MFKSICIKTNSKPVYDYLLKELEYYELEDTYVSCYDFKHYTNVIIHYVGQNTNLFLTKISTLLSYVVIDVYEHSLVRKLINLNYFYFSREEKNKIYELCLNNVDFSSSISNLQIISNEFFKYFSNNKFIILDGFINFKLHAYIKELDALVDMCVNKFVIDKEYNEFISLLKAYIQTNLSHEPVVHLIYRNNNPILLDSQKNVLKYNNNFPQKKYLSDISFSSNDYILNYLLNLLPNKLYIHLIDKEDDFINTLKLIFDNRAYICTDCDLCNLYKSVVTS